jgi:trimethylamine---corrinoid protein Co-methyltransferase
MTASTPPSAVGRLTFLSADARQAVFDTAVDVIERVGMRVLHPEALTLLRDAGAEVADDDLVRLPRRLVLAALATVPHSFTLFDRAGEPAFVLGGYSSVFGTGSDLMRLFDLETGERRNSALADVGRAARLCDALDNIDFVMSSAYPHEVDPHRAYVESFRQMVANTTKPIVVTAENGTDLRVMWRISTALRGGERELRDKPYFVMYGQPSSPLEHPFDSLEKLLLCADLGIPTIYSPAPLAGATAPLTVAGHVAQGVAESLFGLVIHQLRRPGAPFLTGIGPAVLDMATAQSSYNAPEYLLSYMGAVEMARWLDIPNWGYAGTTDSQLVDAQAGMEVAELTLLALQAGSNLNHDVGYLDFGMTGSFEQIVLTDELIAFCRRLLAGITVDADTLAAEVIAEVGPGGHFMGKRHTRQHLRSDQWRPVVLNRKGYDAWLEEGGLDARERARRRALELLASHEPAPLPEGIPAAMDRLIEEFATRQT